MLKDISPFIKFYTGQCIIANHLSAIPGPLSGEYTRRIAVGVEVVFSNEPVPTPGSVGAGLVLVFV
jgi:hypothetical protein